MSVGFAIWLALAVFVGAIWTLRFVLTGPAMKRRCVLSERSHEGHPTPPPRVSIVVAAKDEEADIEACLRSLLDQDYPDFEVIAVNDRSTDRTLEVMRRVEREAGGKLTVVDVDHLPSGWCGKNHAMHQGVSRATGDWFLFTDADCRQTSTRSVSLAMQEVLTHEVDFLSITPVLETRTTWERIFQPVCALVLIFWFLPEKVNDPNKNNAYANGAFMLLSRRGYDAMGGHVKVAAEINEDIHMARHAKAIGLKLRVVENEGLYVTHMYNTMREAWRGWSRIFFGSFASLRRVLIAISFLLTFSLLPWVSMITAWVTWLTVGGHSAHPWGIAAGLWTTIVVIEQLVTMRIYKVVGGGRFWSLFYVVGCAAVLGILINAMLKILGAGSTTWRGTTYRGLARHQRPVVVKQSAANVSGTLPSAPIAVESGSDRSSHV